MDLKRFRTCLIMLFVFTNIFAQPVITLEFPVGAENTGMGESGVSLDNSIYCAFFNPASIASFGKKQNLQFCYSVFNEPLLPAFHLPDLIHSDTTFGIFLNSFIPHLDFGYVHFTNFINFGVNEWTDSLGAVIGQAHSWEVVNANVFAFTFFDALSVGATIKQFNSLLAPGYGPNGQGTAKGTNYDFGIRLHPQFSFKNIITVEPALGIAWQTLGQKSVWYINPAESDPLPRKLLYGMSTTADLLGLFSYTGVFEVDRQDFDVSNSLTDTNNIQYDTSYQARDRTYHEGHKFSITPFYSWYFGYLYGPEGSRIEKTTGSTTTFNYRNLIKTVISITDLFDKNIGKNIVGFENKIIPGFLKLNFYASKSKSTIHSIVPDSQHSPREGQTREDFSWGFSLAGSLESIKKAVSAPKAREAHIVPDNKKPAENVPGPENNIDKKNPDKTDDSQDTNHVE